LIEESLKAKKYILKKHRKILRHKSQLFSITVLVPVTVKKMRVFFDFFTTWYNYEIKLGIYITFLLLSQSMYFVLPFLHLKCLFYTVAEG
jgi:hypothetical protein